MFEIQFEKKKQDDSLYMYGPFLHMVGPVAEVCNGTVSLGNKAQLFNHLSKFGCDIAYDHKYHHTHNQMDLTMRR